MKSKIFYTLRRAFTVSALAMMLMPTLGMADSVMFQANLERTGVYDDIGPEENPELVWKFDAGAPVISTPLVYEGIVYFVDFDGGVYALNQEDGSVIWEKDLGGQPSFEITLNEDLLLVGRRFSRDDDESYLMAVDRLTGEERWKFETDDRSGMDAPAISDNMVFLTSMSKNIFCLDLATGEEIWRHPVQNGSGQLLISDGIVYIQDDWQTVYAFSSATGERIWTYSPPHKKRNSFSTPVIGNGHIFALIINDEDGAIVKLNQFKGAEEAVFPIEFSSMSSISLFDDIVFFGDHGVGDGSIGNMNAMSVRTGELLWRVRTEGSINSSASIAEETVYFGSHDHYMYAVDRHTGELRWRYETGAGIASTPAVVDGRLYFGSIDGHVYVLE